MGEPIKMLLVDDQLDFVQLMAFWFQEKGYSVTFTTSPEEALKIIKENTPDVAFLDLIMPNTDGVALLKKIREFNVSLPVIMMSSYIEDTRIEKKINVYKTSGVFYKGDDFLKAETLLEPILKTKGDQSPPK